MASRCLYRATARELARLNSQGNMPAVLAKRFVEMLGKKPRAGEVTSWANSIPTVVKALIGAGLDDVQVLLEFKTPITDVRIDMVLVGSSPKDGRMAVVVVENKQWSLVSPEPDSELVRVPAAPGRDLRVHPVNQVWGYRQLLADCVPLLRTAEVRCIVNMHGASRRTLSRIQPEAQGLAAWNDEMKGSVLMLGGDEQGKFETALKLSLSPHRAEHYAQELLEALVAPTEGLMTVVGESVSRRSVFPLLDEQRVSFDYVRALVYKSI